MSTEAKVLTGIGIVTVGIVVAAAFFFGGKPTPEKQEVVAGDNVKRLVRKDSHKKGEDGAKVTLVEFGDFQCPACGTAHPVVGQLLEEYKGKDVTFVFRQYPLPMHSNAKPAALAAEAAGVQGKFFEMYDMIYENQAEWSESKNAMDEFFVKYAEDIKLDVDKFKKDIKDKKLEARIKQDMEDATAVGVSATPTFYLNGEEIVGGLPYDQFKKKIDDALKSS